MVEIIDEWFNLGQYKERGGRSFQLRLINPSVIQRTPTGYDGPQGGTYRKE